MKEEYTKFNKTTPGELSNITELQNETAVTQDVDQQILCQNTRPPAIITLYDKAIAPPAIIKLNQYRDDGRDGMTLYTDPSFFLLTWSSEMQKKEENKKEDKRLKRAERRRKRDDTRNVQIPREVKRLRDIKKQNAKGEEFNPDYNPNSQDDVVTNKKKRKKNKQMIGISSQQWEKQHPSKQLQTVVEKEGTGTDQQNEATNGEEFPIPPSQLDEANPPVPMRKSSRLSKYTEGNLPPAPPMPTENGISENRESNLPPPPPILTENGNENGQRQSVAFPPTPYEFYQQSDVDPDLILPPPPLIDDESESFALPPPPLEIDPVVKHRNPKENRISTFILPSLSDNCQKPYIPPTNYPHINEAPESQHIPAAPPPPPPPPTGLPPPPMKSSTEEGSVDSTPKGQLFDSNSLLAMKQKLLDSKKRKVAEVQPSSNSSRNIVDIHAIMTKAIGINRKVMKDSSSSEDDSDDSCTWDD